MISEHNHNTACASSVKYRTVSEKVKEKFLCLFSKGLTPAKALRRHSKDLEDEFQDDFYKIIGDRFYFPDAKWVQRLHDSVFKKEFGSQYGLQMLQKLTEMVDDFDGAKLKIIDEDDNYVISIVTPFMRRVLKEVEQSLEVGEIIMFLIKFMKIIIIILLLSAYFDLETDRIYGRHGHN